MTSILSSRSLNLVQLLNEADRGGDLSTITGNRAGTGTICTITVPAGRTFVLVSAKVSAGLAAVGATVLNGALQVGGVSIEDYDGGGGNATNASDGKYVYEFGSKGVRVAAGVVIRIEHLVGLGNYSGVIIGYLE